MTEEEQAAMVLGATGWQTFWHVTLPNIKWGLVYGVILCNARAMGEFGAVSVVSGHIRGQTNTMPDVAVHTGNPQAMVERIEEIVGELIDGGKFVVTLGGEHTVAVGAARAHAKRVSGLSVLAFDAHADMRDEYLDSPYNHACTLRRISESAPVVQVGLRSAELEEHEYIREQGMRFYSPREFRALGPEGVAALLSDSVYLTFDLDAFDSSVVSAVGTPEPGGLHWDEVSDLLETVARQRRIVGFDVTELAPSLGPRANAQLAAKLVYRIIGLAVGE